MRREIHRFFASLRMTMGQDVHRKDANASRSGIAVPLTAGLYSSRVLDKLQLLPPPEVLWIPARFDSAANVRFCGE